MKSKPFDIPKLLVWEAWKCVKRSGGAPGIDGLSIEDYEKDLKGNLYKLWNRMSSGTYFAQKVKRVAILKGKGQTRILGIPTVECRIAETVLKLYLEPKLDPHFLDESYGYRPGRSAIQAVGKCRENCFRYGWIIDLDLAKFFDTIPHSLLYRALTKHTQTKWVLLYCRRTWVQSAVEEGRGIGQGSPLSPLLANLFLHYAFDRWKKRTLGNSPFERFADDICIHAPTKKSAEYILRCTERRFKAVGLSVNKAKTRIVKCTKQNRLDDDRYQYNSFTFLGYDFKPRSYTDKQGKLGLIFTPGAGRKATLSLTSKLKVMRIDRRTDLSITQVLKFIYPIVTGWINYFRHFRPSEMKAGLSAVEWRLQRWVQRKFKVGRKASIRILSRLFQEMPSLFAHRTAGIRIGAYHTRNNR